MRLAFRISLLAIGLASLLGAGTASAGTLVEFPNLPGHTPANLTETGMGYSLSSRSGAHREPPASDCAGSTHDADRAPSLSIFLARAIDLRMVRSAKPIFVATSALNDATASCAVALPIASFAATAPAVCCFDWGRSPTCAYGSPAGRQAKCRFPAGSFRLPICLSIPSPCTNHTRRSGSAGRATARCGVRQGSPRYGSRRRCR